MLTQSGEENLAVIDDDGRVAGVVDIRQIVRAIAPPEPTPVGKGPIPNRRLIHNDDTLTPTVLWPNTPDEASMAGAGPPPPQQ
jgi:hypothetical protein